VVFKNYAQGKKLGERRGPNRPEWGGGAGGNVEAAKGKDGTSQLVGPR